MEGDLEKNKYVEIISIKNLEVMEMDRKTNENKNDSREDFEKQDHPVRLRKNSIQERRKITRGQNLDKLLVLDDKEEEDQTITEGSPKLSYNQKSKPDINLIGPKSPLAKLLKTVSFHGISNKQFHRNNSFNSNSSDSPRENHKTSPNELITSLPSSSSSASSDKRNSLQFFNFGYTNSPGSSPIFNKVFSYNSNRDSGDLDCGNNEKFSPSIKESLNSMSPTKSFEFKKKKLDKLVCIRNKVMRTTSSSTSSSLNSPKDLSSFQWENSESQNIEIKSFPDSEIQKSE